MKKELTKSYSLFSAHGLVIGCFLLFALACAPMDDKYAGQKRGAIQGPLKVSTNLDPGDIRAQICLGSDLSAGAPHFLFTNQL